ncbi:hypothetical protein [Streptomyces sp. NPDC091217]|uniref:hypothetical protein n=1 Tax=Streptomyces sp. NPDC091217 TaxID=3365975 RepID=UPI0038067A39
MSTPGPSGQRRPSAATLPSPVNGKAVASGRLMVSIAGSQFGVATVYGAVPSVLLPLQVERLAGDDKAGVLSLFTLADAVTALIAQPFAGSLSDRTRTRYGSRTPCVLGGSLLAAPVLWAMGRTQSVAVLAVLGGVGVLRVRGVR